MEQKGGDGRKSQWMATTRNVSQVPFPPSQRLPNFNHVIEIDLATSGPTLTCNLLII